MIFFTALGTLVTAATAYLVRQFASGDLAARQDPQPTAQPEQHESLKAA